MEMQVLDAQLVLEMTPLFKMSSGVADFFNGKRVSSPMIKA